VAYLNHQVRAAGLTGGNEPIRFRPVALALMAEADTQGFYLHRPRAGGSEQNVNLAAPCDRASRYHHREGPQLWKPNMRKLITTIALLALVDTSMAIAQTIGSRNPAAHRLTNSGQQLLPGAAPVGHRQPRADQVPS
jgi:hypothetical protein